MLVRVCLLVLSQPVPEGFVPHNTAEQMRFNLKLEGEGWSFDWADQEDRVRGTVTPPELAAGSPLQVSIAVGAFASGDFDGPVTVTLEHLDGSWRELSTVHPAPMVPRVWNATFTPPASGQHRLEISFRSTRVKSISAPLEVGMGRVSTPLALGLASALVLAFVAVGLLQLFRARS